MKKDSLEDIIKTKIENIDVFLKEIEEVNKNIPLIAKVVSDKLNDIVEQD